MTDLVYVNHRLDPASWASDLGVSVHACRLLLDADFVDLNNALDLPVRWFGYRPHRHHGVARRPPIGTGHTDFPRLREASFTGVVAAIRTPLAATPRGRLRATFRRVEALVDLVRAHASELAPVVDRAGYDQAREAGRTAFFVALASARGLLADPTVLAGPLGQQLHRVALVGDSRSDVGGTGRYAGFDDGLGEIGRRIVDQCAEARVLVDLAQAGLRTFDDALAHRGDLPFVVSHAGAREVRDHWANLSDDQIAQIAERGGVVGVGYDGRTLADVRASGSRADVLAHFEHLFRVGGEHVAAIGTTYDGFIVPPHDMPDVTHHPRLVQDMLDRGWSEDRIRNVLGRNYLRTIALVRPGRQETRQS